MILPGLYVPPGTRQNNMGDKIIWGKIVFTGRGAAWLARLLWEQEVASSNLAAPTGGIAASRAGETRKSRGDQNDSPLSLSPLSCRLLSVFFYLLSHPGAGADDEFQF